ncbi:hypothetical protein HMSSN139_38040 [Paenibacillus sp. HMSSN-139]|nr:hypothetical protein HMSSN139_38040 [Paenibacillus sp. HMSSN-139]
MVGALGAVVLRCVLTWVAVILLKIPFIHAAGGVLLAAIAFKLLLPQEEHSRVAGAGSMWKAVQTILAADFIMSLDNVLAIAALAEGDVSILVIGIAISIPIVVWGSNLIADWLHRLPILVYAGAGILGYTAGEMLLQDPQLGPALAAAAPALAHAVPAVTAAVVIMFGWLRKYNAGRG